MTTQCPLLQLAETDVSNNTWPFNLKPNLRYICTVTVRNRRHVRTCTVFNQSQCTKSLLITVIIEVRPSKQLVRFENSWTSIKQHGRVQTSFALVQFSFCMALPLRVKMRDHVTRRQPLGYRSKRLTSLGGPRLKASIWFDTHAWLFMTAVQYV